MKVFWNLFFGKLFGDKGYISEKLNQLLFVDGIQPITSIRSDMKNSLMEMSDKNTGLNILGQLKMYFDQWFIKP